MADVADSKSVGSDTVRVQVPPSARTVIPLNYKRSRGFPLSENMLIPFNLPLKEKSED